MKAEELRIGNWVSTAGCNIRVCPKDYEDTKYLHPIPLTEEILLKAGFEGNYQYEKFNKDGSIDYVICADDVMKVYVGCGSEYYVRDLLYVHDLQNFHFALTGEELEIQL